MRPIYGEFSHTLNLCHWFLAYYIHARHEGVSNNNCKYNGKTLIIEDMLVPRLDKGILVISVTALFIFGKKFHLG